VARVEVSGWEVAGLDQDPLIASLLDSGHLTRQPDLDPDYATLHITDVGRDAILGRQKRRGDFLPSKP
jgi:hypothetical protein